MSTESSNAPIARDADHIRQMRAQHSQMRERDFARMLDISEADVLAAFNDVGASELDVRRIGTEFDTIFPGLQGVGEVMALTRNESAVHEKIGCFEKYVQGKNAALMLGTQIDMRMFRSSWVYGFAVEKQDGEKRRHSLQFFDKYGDAVQKIHARPDTDLDAWTALVDLLLLKDQGNSLPPKPQKAAAEKRTAPAQGVQKTLQERWQNLTDPHQFRGMLNDLELHRLTAFETVGKDWAWKLDQGSVSAMLRLAASESLPIMCFVGNRGCIQIHSGPIASVMDKGPWINVLDPTFHLHLRTDHITDVWAVRKPADRGYVTSVEAYDKDGNQIIQFFGVRGEGNDERTDWRELVENLPQISSDFALEAAS